MEGPIQEGFPEEGKEEGCWNRGSSDTLEVCPPPELREGSARGARLGQGEAGSGRAGFPLLSLGALSRTRLQG